MRNCLISIALCITGLGIVMSSDSTEAELYHIVLTGLDGSGKTTIFNQLTQVTQKETVPTIGFDVSEILYKNITFAIWDIGGQCRLRRLWRNWIHKESLVIYVVDRTDIKRLKVAKTELHRLFDDPEMQNSITVLLNKEDLTDGISIEDAIEQLELSKLKQNWHVIGTSAIRGDGLNDALEHIYQIETNKNIKS